MESDGALTMLKRCYNEYRVFFKHIVSDDDSTMRSLLKHENNGGDLPSSIIQPIFLADPGHRIKCMAKPIFALENLSLKYSTCRKVHALRLKK